MGTLTRSQPEVIIPKLSSEPGPNKELTVSHVGLALQTELKDAEFIKVHGLVDHIFPDATLGISPEAVLAFSGQQSHPIHTNGKWSLATFSPEGFTSLGQEDSCAHLLNAVGALATLAAGKNAPKRLWVPYNNKGLPGIDATRQPDIGLFDNCDPPTSATEVIRLATSRELPPRCPTQTYQTLRSTCQVKSNTGGSSSARRQLRQDAYFAFSSQCNRRYFLGISFCGTKVALSLFDRSGCVHSKYFDVDEEPLTFIRLVAGLSSGSNTAIGYDPTITCDSKGDPTSIRIESQEYAVVRTEFIGDMIRGRGTVCYHARRNGTDYAVKDGWAKVALRPEEDMLRAAQGIRGVPVLVAAWDVQVDGRPDSTSWPRACILYSTSGPGADTLAKLEVRQHRRLVMTPFASPLTTFKSKVELLSALRDVIQGE